MSFLGKLFRSAPVDPGVPLARALEAAQALKALPEIGGDQQKDRALVGLIESLKAAGDALTSGRDDQGIPISRPEIADRLRRTRGYMKQRGVWERVAAHVPRETRAALAALDKDMDQVEKALRG